MQGGPGCRAARRTWTGSGVWGALECGASPNADAGTNTSPANSSLAVRRKLPPLIVIASPSPVVSIATPIEPVGCSMMMSANGPAGAVHTCRATVPGSMIAEPRHSAPVTACAAWQFQGTK